MKMQAKFTLNQLVSVRERTGPNENKQGGVGRIMAIADDQSHYDIKYVLGGKEFDVHEQYISEHSFDQPKERSRGAPRTEIRPILAKKQHVDQERNPQKRSGEPAKENNHANEIVETDDAEKVDVTRKDVAGCSIVVSSMPSKDANLLENSISTGLLSDADLDEARSWLAQQLSSRDRILITEAMTMFSSTEKAMAAINALEREDIIFVTQESGEIWSL